MLKKDYNMYELRMDVYGCNNVLMNNEQVMTDFTSITVDNLNLSKDIIDHVDIEVGKLNLTIKSNNNFDYYNIVEFVKQYWLSHKVVWNFSVRGFYKIKTLEEGAL